MKDVICVKQLSVQVGTFSLKDVSFVIPSGAYGILMGKTGSGKTTILEAICGLKSVVKGSIQLLGRDITHLKPSERGVGFVPQEGALFPTMSIRDQIGFALSIRKWKKTKISQRVEELASLLGIKNLLERNPHGLSGGERQRVALGRALAPHPGVLCLDEPLSALDDAMKEDLVKLLKKIQKETGVTTLHITHSKHEAKRLADKTLILQDGKIEESKVS